jgi:hypothetical protein
MMDTVFFKNNPFLSVQSPGDVEMSDNCGLSLLSADQAHGSQLILNPC